MTEVSSWATCMMIPARGLGKASASLQLICIGGSSNCIRLALNSRMNFGVLLWVLLFVLFILAERQKLRGLV